jgi:uncharacterized membrane protein YfcA
MSLGLAIAIVAAGVLVGILSAMFGVGGGILMVPFMVLVLHEQQHLAEGTSLLVIVPTAVAGVLVHRRSNYVAVRVAAFLAIGGIAGAWVGAFVALRLEAETLQTVFGIVMLLAGIRVVRRGITKARGENVARTDGRGPATAPRRPDHRSANEI